MIVLVVYVPASHLEPVKQAMFEAGAGRIGDYSHCAWQVLGRGQFKPSEAADPFIGAANQVSHVDEYRVEMVCEDAILQPVLAAMVAAHPYEEPAYHAYPSMVN